jgi:transcriptional regulator with XRE-family HTH domain
MSPFADWLTKKFVEWQAKIGKRKTLDDFAAYIGVSRPLINLWMNGTKSRPGPENIKILAEIFGYEIYDILKIPRPHPLQLYVARNWGLLPDKEQKQISEIVAKYTADPIPKDETEETSPKEKPEWKQNPKPPKIKQK